MELSMETSQKLQTELPYYLLIPLLGIIPKNIEALIWRYININVYQSTICNYLDLQTTQMSNLRWVDKEIAVYKQQNTTQQ